MARQWRTASSTGAARAAARRAAAFRRVSGPGHGVRLWDEALNGQIYLGKEAFVKRMQARSELLEASDIPRAQRQIHAHTLQWYIDCYDHDTAIVRAHLEGAHTQSMIARAVGLSVSRVSRLVTAHEALKASGKENGAAGQAVEMELNVGALRQRESGLSLAL